jgi:predicted DNA-binding transcriptional regulator AlpA
MDKKTTVEAVRALGITRKTLLTILIYHPELRPGQQPRPLTLAHCNYVLWSEAEIEQVRAHCTRQKPAYLAA